MTLFTEFADSASLHLRKLSLTPLQLRFLVLQLYRYRFVKDHVALNDFHFCDRGLDDTSWRKDSANFTTSSLFCSRVIFSLFHAVHGFFLFGTQIAAIVNCTQLLEALSGHLSLT